MSNNRSKLEKNAMKAVQANGLKALSFRAMAEEIGIKSSSVHYHFPEKSDLARALIERYSETFFDSLQEIENNRWKLRRKISAFIEIFETVAEENRLCLCGMMAAEVEQLSAENRALLASFFADTERWLTQLFSDHSGELQTSLPPEVLARNLLAGLEGALLLDRVMRKNERLSAQKTVFLGTFLS